MFLTYPCWFFYLVQKNRISLFVDNNNCKRKTNGKFTFIYLLDNKHKQVNNLNKKMSSKIAIIFGLQMSNCLTSWYEHKTQRATSDSSFSESGLQTVFIFHANPLRWEQITASISMKRQIIVVPYCPDFFLLRKSIQVAQMSFHCLFLSILIIWLRCVQLNLLYLLLLSVKMWAVISNLNANKYCMFAFYEK